ncbi:MAG: hypothetical protein ACP5US_00050 [Candidatus Kryptoniota bacterium]
MAINGIDPRLSIGNTPEIKKKVENPENTEQSEGSSAVKDKLQLSAEAIKSHEQMVENRLSQIRQKVDNGFYSNEDVLDSVAAALVKAIKGS